MSIPVCHGCGSTEFRTSHLRGSDFRKLLTLQYPIRCRICKERNFIFVGKVLNFTHRDRKKKTAAVA